jgi:hypothetical protein
MTEEGMFFLVVCLLRGGVPLLRALPEEISEERKKGKKSDPGVGGMATHAP